MTVIAYHKGVLAADSRGLVLNSQFNKNFTNAAAVVRKAKLLGGGCFALAVTGTVPSETEWCQMDHACRLLLTFIEICDEVLPWNAERYTKKHFVDTHRHAILMSRKAVYSIVDGHVGCLPKGEPLSFGTGAVVAHSAMQAGMDALQATDMACQVKYTCGYPLLSFKQQDLRVLATKAQREIIRKVYFEEDVTGRTKK